jgi:hypothetical protein
MSVYGERVYRVGDEVADALEDCPMAGEARQPEEVLRHDRYEKVPGTRCRAGVTHVLVAVVADLEQRRREWCEPRGRIA